MGIDGVGIPHLQDVKSQRKGGRKEREGRMFSHIEFYVLCNKYDTVLQILRLWRHVLRWLQAHAKTCPNTNVKKIVLKSIEI